MRGIWHFNHYTAEHSRRAETWLRRALDLDHDLALANLYLARVLNNRIWWGWSTEIDKELADEYAAAKRAVFLDERDPYAHYAMFLASMLTLKHEQALVEAQRSIDLNPNFALGWIRIYLGRAAEAIDPLLRSQRLNPNDPQVDTYLGQTALAHYHLKDYEEAIRCAVGGLRKRRHPFALRTLIASLGQLGRVREARAASAELASLNVADDRYWEVTMPYADAALRAEFDEGLRKAGMQT
jgi:tetratricopeptide (TPR) repeat protein